MSLTTQELLKQVLTSTPLEDESLASDMLIDEVATLLCKQLDCDGVVILSSCFNNPFAPSLHIVDNSVKTIASHFCHHLAYQGSFTQGLQDKPELIDAIFERDSPLHHHFGETSAAAECNASKIKHDDIIKSMFSLIGNDYFITHFEMTAPIKVGNVKAVIGAFQFVPKATQRDKEIKQGSSCQFHWQNILEENAFQIATAFELRRLAKVLDDKEKQYQELFSHLPLACALIDTNNKVALFNKVFEHLFPLSLGQSLFDVLSDDEHEMLRDTLHIVREGVMRQAWCELPLNIGISTHWFKLSFCQALNSQKQLLLMIEDVTERYRLADELTYHSNYDVLTGLPNRVQFESLLDELLTKEETIPASVAFLDLYQFQVVNDLSGHQAGDELLLQVSKRLKQLVRKGDVVARLGGDEFGILMYYSDDESCKQVATRICNQLFEHEFRWKKVKHNVSMSIGLAKFNQDAKDIYEVMSQADAACRLAKEEGRNRWHFFNPDDPQINTLYTQMLASVDITGALALNQFELFYQLIEPLNNNESGIHMEILLRLVQEDGSFLSPGIFLPAAERYNLASRIDKWVIDNLLRWGSENLSIWQELAMVSVNLSAMSLADQKFMSWLEMRLMVEPELVDKLCFEITETAAVSQLDQAKALIDLLKPLGCKLALDDFGSGFSSFAYLKSLDVDFVKIDGQFVVNLCTDKHDKAIVSAICQLGQDMEFDVIAEFVENIEIGLKLKSLGVDYGQGYAINKPCPLNGLSSGLRTPWQELHQTLPIIYEI